MTKSSQLEKLILELSQEDVQEALKFTAGMFVGLYMAFLEDQGHDISQDIKIKGGKGQRNITIHALPTHQEKKNEKVSEKTFGLIIFEKNDFLRKRGKVIKTKAINHSVAMNYFTSDFGPELVNQTIMTFCFEENNKHYGYGYSIINES